jgi:hypothetical protein
MEPISNLSTVKELEPGLYEQKTNVIMNEGPTLDKINQLRLANSVTTKGFSDDRLMKFRAEIPSWRVWEAENLLGFNLSDKTDFRKYLILHPEYIVSPENTGHSGRIIIK